MYFSLRALVGPYQDLRTEKPTIYRYGYSKISSEYIWYNKYIRIAGKPVSFRTLEERGIKHMSDLFFENGSHIPWFTLKDLHSIPST